MTTTGERLAVALKERDMTASDLARELNISRAAVSLWLHDKANMSADNARQVARILEVSSRWLVDGEMKTPAGEWLELTPLEFEVIRVLRKYEANGSQLPMKEQPKAVLKQYLNVDGTISIGE